MKRNAWKPESPHTRTRWWLAHRLLPASVFALALGAFFVFLAQPLFHPRVHLLFAEADYSAGRLPGPSPAADLEAVNVAPLALLGELHAKEAAAGDAFASPAALSAALERIHRRTVRSGDVLMVWLSGELVTRDGRIELLCENFDPADLDGGCLDFQQALDHLHASRAATKLLVLDTGHVSYCPRLGTVVNTSVDQIAPLVAATQDAGLWVLLAHGDLERSHVLADARRSALARFCGEALHGAADANADRYVDVGEFYRFVRQHVSEFVRQQTGGRDAQTPQLLWGGGAWNEKTTFPVLMPVEPPPSAASAEEEEGKEGEESEKKGEAGEQEHGGEGAEEAGHGEAKEEGHKGGAKDAKAAPPPPPPRLNPPPAALLAVRPPETKLDGRAGLGEQPRAPPPSAAAETKEPHEPAALPKAAGIDPVVSAPAVELAAMAWSVHDRLAASARLRPISTAPHLWRAFEDTLVACELALQSGDERKLATLTPQLRRLVRQANDLAEARTPQIYAPHDLLPDLAEAAAPVGRDLSARSLAMAEQLVLYGGPLVPPDVAVAAERLDRALAAANKSDLQKWAKETPSGNDEFLEFRLARRLALRDDVSWEHVKLVLAAEFLAEKTAAATLDAGRWTGLSIERADALRQLGRRMVLEPVRPGDPQTGAALLEQAVAEYICAAAWNNDAAGLERSLEGALFDLPDVLRWSISAAASPSGGEEAEKALEGLLPVLRQAIEVVDAPSAAHLPEVRRLRLDLDDGMAKLRQAVARDLNLPNEAAAGKTDASLAGRAAASSAGAASPPIPSLHDALTAIAARPDAGLAASDLRRRLLALSLGAAPAKSDEAASAEEADIAPRVKAARERFGEVVSLLQSDESKPSALDGAEQERHEEHNAQHAEAAEYTGDAARKLLESLPAKIHRTIADNQDLSDPAQRAARLRQLRAAARLVNLLDPWDVDRLSGPPPAVLIRRARLYDLFAWQQRRYAADAAAAPAAECEELMAVAAAYAAAAEAVPQQPPLNVPAQAGASIDALAAIDLADKAERDVLLTVANRDPGRQAVWLTADYDPEVLELLPGDNDRDRLYDARTLTGEPIYFAGPMSVPVDPRQAAAAPDYLAADRAAIRGRAPSCLLTVGESRGVWVRIRRKTLAGGDARVIFHALAAPSDAAGGAPAAMTSFRHDLAVQLPRRLSIDLAADGVADAWGASETGLLLYPFPNQKTAYRFSLVNSSAVERQVSVDVYRTETPAAAPRGDVPLAVAQQYLSRIGSGGEPIAHAEKIVLPATGERVAVPFAAPGKEEKAAASAETKTPAPAGAEPAPPALSPVLAVVITDRASNRCAVKTIEILTQRPARYLRTHAEYDPLRRRLDIAIRAREANALPPEGVHVVAIPQVPESERVYHAGVTLHRAAPEATLHVEVPREISGIYPVALEVDGFARAFCYEVPTRAASSVPVPEVSRAAVRILKPKAGALYGPQAADVPVELEVDVPHGLLLDSSNCVELGLDLNRDRELEHEDTVRLSSDRQVDLTAAAIGPNGKFTIGTKVGDLKYKLPPPPRRALRANVLARLFLPESIVWSEPVEVVFDDQPPRLMQLQLDPGGKVTAGDDLTVSVLASDNDLSGVAKVEAAFDLQRKGEFGTPPPVAGSVQSDGRWQIVLPTKPLTPGVQTVLVRATDRCDNASEYLKATVEVVAKSTAPAEQPKPQLGQLSGRVVYGRFEKRPVADAVVQLTSKAAANAPPPLEAKTDAEGNFHFADVPPGDYKLASEQLLGGNRRTAHKDIKVPVPPEAAPPAELILQTAR